MRLRLLPSCALFLVMTAATGLCSENSDDLDSLWNSAVQSLQTADSPKAEAQLRHWILKASEKNISSAAAFSNLALAEWNNEKRAHAAYHYLQAAVVSASPLEAFRRWKFFTQLEQHAGVREGAHQDRRFTLRLLLSRNTVAMLLSFSFWIFVVMTFLKWFQRERDLDTSWYVPLMGVPVLLLVVASMGYLNLRYGPVFAMLQSSDEIAVFEQANSENKLVTLPAGTVIQVGNRSGGFIQMLEPVTGWVEEKNCLPIQFFSDSSAPTLALKN